ncbi:hypothetical protein EOL73_02250, partial [Candidatus Saccharibacteria bacterium]|nr:hypothetical protein [Candidatus Saccharibacteria bacterium]NCU40559.1 hypothetical protein [Candidatus Saccharibacteria bacterium]
MDENSSDYTNNDPPESTPDQIQPEDTSYTNPDPQSEVAPTENTSEEVEFIPGTVSWTAAEYAESEKSRNWFVILILGAVILAGLALFLLSDWI